MRVVLLVGCLVVLVFNLIANHFQITDCLTENKGCAGTPKEECLEKTATESALN